MPTIAPPNEIRGPAVRAMNLDHLTVTVRITDSMSLDHDPITDLRLHGILLCSEPGSSLSLKSQDHRGRSYLVGPKVMTGNDPGPPGWTRDVERGTGIDSTWECNRHRSRRAPGRWGSLV